MGRKRIVPKGPRIIDIDILLHGTPWCIFGALTFRMPGMAERRFVLEPLVELVPELRHPESMKMVRDLLASTVAQVVKKTDIRLQVPARSA